MSAHTLFTSQSAHRTINKWGKMTGLGDVATCSALRGQERTNQFIVHFDTRVSLSVDKSNLRVNSLTQRLTWLMRGWLSPL